MKNKFNVHLWNGMSWQYLATATAENEQEACMMIECRYGKGKYQAYPHIDNAIHN